MKRTNRNTPTFVPALTGKDPRAAQKAAQQHGKNDHSQELQRCLDFLSQNYSSFDERDFVIATRHLDIDFQEVQEFFNRAVKQMCQDERCLEIFGGYEKPIYRVL